MEIEIKIQTNDLKRIEKDIIGLGAKLKKSKKQIDQYFGEIVLYKKIGYSFLIRLRQEDDKKFLTYKGDHFKKPGIWQEYEFEIDDIKRGEKMLKDMGLEKIITVKKKRKEYFLDGLTICLDDIENLGKFIEIEYLSNKTFSKKKLKDFIKKLKIKEDKIIDKGYVTMLLEKNKSIYKKYIIN